MLALLASGVLVAVALIVAGGAATMVYRLLKDEG